MQKPTEKPLKGPFSGYTQSFSKSSWSAPLCSLVPRCHLERDGLVTLGWFPGFIKETVHCCMHNCKLITTITKTVLCHCAEKARTSRCCNYRSYFLQYDLWLEISHQNWQKAVSVNKAQGMLPDPFWVWAQEYPLGTHWIHCVHWNIHVLSRSSIIHYIGTSRMCNHGKHGRWAWCNWGGSQWVNSVYKPHSQVVRRKPDYEKNDLLSGCSGI